MKYRKLSMIKIAYLCILFLLQTCFPIGQSIASEIEKRPLLRKCPPYPFTCLSCFFRSCVFAILQFSWFIYMCYLDIFMDEVCTFRCENQRRQFAHAKLCLTSLFRGTIVVTCRTWVSYNLIFPMALYLLYHVPKCSVSH